MGRRRLLLNPPAIFEFVRVVNGTPLAVYTGGMWRLFLSFLLFAIGPTAQAGTILELDQDFFENSGRIEDAPAGEYGCTTVSGRSEKSEAQRLGLRMQRYCAGEVSVLFIRDRNRFESFKLQSQREGYYQVCCRKKGVKEGRRRTRSQAD